MYEGREGKEGGRENRNLGQTEEQKVRMELC